MDWDPYSQATSYNSCAFSDIISCTMQAEVEQRDESGISNAEVDLVAGN